MADPRAQQRFNVEQTHKAYNRFADLYDNRHPQASSRITNYAYTLSGKRGY